MSLPEPFMLFPLVLSRACFFLIFVLFLLLFVFQVRASESLFIGLARAASFFAFVCVLVCQLFAKSARRGDADVNALKVSF